MKRREEDSNLRRLIGYDTLNRPFESWYAYVSRLIVSNLLSDSEIRKQLPSDWVRWAFAPHEIQSEDLEVPDQRFPKIPDHDLKFRPDAWQLFPELSSGPPECLRGCPHCLGDGYHSYATQSDLIARCPVHKVNLVHRCPHCDTQLLWKSHSPGSSAFRCPAGCPLCETVHSGLFIPYGGELNNAWQAHFKWVKAMRLAIVMVSGPVHIAYPPYLAIAPMRVPALPSRGLLPALSKLLQKNGVSLPGFAPYHNQSKGRWTLHLQPWVGSEQGIHDDDDLEMLRRGFRRGAYQTFLPLTKRGAFERWLSESEAKFGRWHLGEISDFGTFTAFRLPSYLITNNEMVALRRLLARGSNPGLAFAHYHRVLIDLLEHARARRIALDALDRPSSDVTRAESVDMIVRTGTQYWRVSGHTKAEDDSRETWRDFREMAEMNSGIIHVTRRYGPL